MRVAIRMTDVLACVRKAEAAAHEDFSGALVHIASRESDEKCSPCPRPTSLVVDVNERNEMPARCVSMTFPLSRWQ